MTASALLMTILFIADDPQAPMVVVDVVEDRRGRSVDVFVVPPTGPALSASLLSAPIDAPERPTQRRWPLLPTGAALTPALDGAILTFDDIGLWEEPLPPPPTSMDHNAAPEKTGKTRPAAKAKASSTVPSNVAPDLRVASATTLRLYVSAIVDEQTASLTSSPVPVPASLHGSHTRLAGTALVLTRPLPVVALSMAEGEADAGPALIAAFTPGDCAPVPTRIVQALSTLSATTTSCTQRLAVSRGDGKRYGVEAKKDRDAAGIVVVRLPHLAPTSP